jgi:hypothetical protein
MKKHIANIITGSRIATIAAIQESYYTIKVNGE